MPEGIRGALCDSLSLGMAEASVLIAAAAAALSQGRDTGALREVFLSFRSANNLKKNQHPNADEDKSPGE